MSTAVPFRYRRWFLLPLWALVFLILFSPHALDISVSHLFFSVDHWPWHRVEWFSTLFHKAAKGIPVAVALVTLGALVRDALRRKKGLPVDPALRARLLYLFAAMLAAVLLVWRLKGVTGVACPWDVNIFGGDTPVRDPSFSFFRQPGNCWPAGHAGSGFCLFALYFFWRDASPRRAAAAFWFALLFGFFCGWIRLMQGAHFLSHVIATGLIDWLVCAALYVLFFARETIAKALARIAKPVSHSNHAVVWMTALWWTLVFDIGYYRQILAGTTAENAASILTTTGMSALLFFFVSASLLYALSLFPKIVFRTATLLLNLLGGLSLTAALLYGVIMTPDMIRNFLATDTHEALGYFSLRTVLLYLIVTLPPVLLLVKIERRDRLWVPALCSVAALLISAGTVFLGMQGFSSAMRNDKSLRYQIAPVNIVYSTATTLLTDKNPDAEIRRIVVDERPTLEVVPDGKSLLVVVIGETTRTANWQPAGYARETAPRLTADKEVLHLPRVLACGTSTDVSLPCMLSRVGRRDYDRERIVSEESLPALLQRAGVSVSWIENQSGCKGTCAGVPTRKPEPVEALCPSGVCFDEIFAKEVRREVDNLQTGRPAVVFLHMMGSHGPAYWSRSPESDKAFRPECQDADLGSCSKEEIAAAYDNSVRHTDRALAEVLAELRTAAQAGVATGLVYVSDHGESLGENGLFLHGAPYWMAPAEQIEVPGVLWLSDNYRRTFGIDYERLVQKARGDVRHDHLYHTVLGLLKVRSSAYDRTWDLTS